MADNIKKIISDEIWREVINQTKALLKEKELTCKFNPPKYDGSYVKSAMSSGVCFTFAANNREVWVELEIKAKGNQPQEELYNQIKTKSLEISKNFKFNIRWDEQDRIVSSRRASGGDYRIKSIMDFTINDIKSHNVSIQLWAERMVSFMLAFSPYVPAMNYKNKNVTNDSKVRIKRHLPDKSDIEHAYHLLRKSPRQVINIEDILNQVEKNMTNIGIELEENWREIIKKRIEKWFQKK